jgi:hypothetical protein
MKFKKASLIAFLFTIAAMSCINTCYAINPMPPEPGYFNPMVIIIPIIAAIVIIYVSLYVYANYIMED